MTLDIAVLERLVDQVVREVASQVERRAAIGTPSAPGTAHDGIFEDMDAAVKAAKQAHLAYLQCTMSDRRRFVAALRAMALRPEVLDHLATATVEETGMGDVDDKRLKNKMVAELTPGVEDLITEAWSGDAGLTTVEYSAFGVIGAITPTTNPTETLICNSIGMLAAGNSVVFSPHPRARQVTLWLVRRFNEALAEAGAPPNLITMVREPTLEMTQSMMTHPDVRMLVATGGPGIVEMVLRSGKKAIGAGAGNPPVVVDETADIDQAACDIVNGASFDNNLPCIAEKEVIVVDEVADLLILHMKRHGAYEVKEPAVIARLHDLVFKTETQLKAEWVGQSATKILDAVGVQAPAGTRLIIVETGKDHPFVQREMMTPILPVVRAKDVDTAIAIAIEVEHGNRHTAVMHSKNVSSLTRMARLIQTTIFVKNGPSYAGIGIGGEGYCSFTIAGPTGEGLTSARTFARRRRCILVGDLNVR